MIDTFGVASAGAGAPEITTLLLQTSDQLLAELRAGLKGPDAGDRAGLYGRCGVGSMMAAKDAH
jgi:hypothetical protein